MKRDLKAYEEWLDWAIVHEGIENVEDLDLISGDPGEQIRIRFRRKQEFMFVFGEEQEQAGMGTAAKGSNMKKGAGQGAQGQGGGRPGTGQGAGQGSGAGTEPGVDSYDVERARLKRILYKRFKLPPPMERLGKRKVSLKVRYRRKGYLRRGPRGRLAIERTAREHLARKQAARRVGKPQHPFPYKEDDLRFHRLRPKHSKVIDTVVAFIGDFSGSLTKERLLQQKAFAAWIADQIAAEQRGRVKGKTTILFGAHDVEFKWVEESNYFRKNNSGGTKFSPAYKALGDLATRYPPDRTEHFIFHFTDGENQKDDEADSLVAIEKLCEFVRLFGYIELGESSSSFRFGAALEGKKMHGRRRKRQWRKHGKSFGQDHPNFFQGKIVKDEDLPVLAEQLIQFLSEEV